MESTLTASPARSQQNEFQSWINVGANERWISSVGGGALAYFGLRHGGLSGLLCMAAGTALVYRGVTGHCPAYAATGTNTNNDPPPAPEQYFERGIHVDESITIDRDPQELYDFWRNFENLPVFMTHLKSVKNLDANRSHWVAKAPAGLSIAWDAEVINDEAPRVIAWRSLAGSLVDNAGSVRFVPAPGGRGTEVRVVLDYIPPAGRLGWAVAKLFGEEPSGQVREDLRHFKQFMETGEVPTIEGQPHGA